MTSNTKGLTTVKDRSLDYQFVSQVTDYCDKRVAPVVMIQKLYS